MDGWESGGCKVLNVEPEGGVKQVLHPMEMENENVVEFSKKKYSRTKLKNNVYSVRAMKQHFANFWSTLLRIMFNNFYILFFRWNRNSLMIQPRAEEILRS